MKSVRTSDKLGVLLIKPIAAPPVKHSAASIINHRVDKNPRRVKFRGKGSGSDGGIQVVHNITVGAFYPVVNAAAAGAL